MDRLYGNRMSNAVRGNRDGDMGIPFYDGPTAWSEEARNQQKETMRKTEAAALIKQSLGKPAGYLKVKEGKTASLMRLSKDSGGGDVRYNVGQSRTLPAGTVVNYYLVNGSETTYNRYYISLESHVAWVDASVMEKTKDGSPDDTAKVNLSINPRTINYKQYDNRWASIKYGKNNTTYSEAGCGPTSAANIAVRFGHAEVTPLTMGDLALSSKARAESGGQGTDGEILFKAMSSKYGISVSPGCYYKPSIKEKLESIKGASGKYAIVKVNSSKWGNGHFMTLYGYDGKDVYIDDPNTWNEKEDAKTFISAHIKCIWICG